MRTLIIEKHLYKYEDLSSTAKSAALVTWSANRDYDWSECENTLEKAAKIFNFEVKRWALDYGSANIQWEANWGEDVDQLTGPRLLAYIWNHCRELWKGKYYSCAHRWEDGKYHYVHRRSNVILDDDCTLTGVFFDCAVTDIIGDLWKRHGGWPTYGELVKQIVERISKLWWDDYDYFTTDEEALLEDAECNDIMFTEDGYEIYYGMKDVEEAEDEEGLELADK